MGLAILFRVDESCISNHTRQGDGRVLRVSEDSEDTVEGEEESGSPVDKTQPEKVEQKVEPVANESSSKSFRPAEETLAVRENEDEAEEAGEQTQREGKKRISAKERRDMKKSKLPAPEQSIDEQQPPALQKRKDNGKNKNLSQVPQQKKSVRGKKGKLKKMKKKYADQDDEDRRLRMEALGHVVEEEQESENQSKEDDSAEPSEGDDGESTTDGNTKEVSEEYIRQQREKKEKFLDEQEDEAEGADFFDAFTGEPLADDIVLFAMPMCAPYASLTKFKYKVKLTPGSQKKGKAAKQAME
ncbi:hypothetical protein PHPALM_30181, partial [Phytophthora palmivora]